jgi:hypothetical protein
VLAVQTGPYSKYNKPRHPSPTCPGHYNNPLPNPVLAAAALRRACSDWPDSDPLLPAPHRSQREAGIEEGAEETTRSPIGRRLRASLRAQWSVPARSRLSPFRPSLPLLPRCLLRLLFPCFLIGAFVMALFFSGRLGLRCCPPPCFYFSGGGRVSDKAVSQFPGAKPSWRGSCCFWAGEFRDGVLPPVGSGRHGC